MSEAKRLWECNHPYYATEGCYFVAGNRWGDVHAEWDSWADFYEEWGNSDPDLNLLYRWDWNRPDPADYEPFGEEVPGDYLQLFYMMQRKARPFSHNIQVTEADEPAVRAFLAERARTVRAIWEPIIEGDESNE